MNQVHNALCTPKNYIEPAIFIGFAFLAGSTRLIKYLPDTSRSGLLISAGLASAASAIYDHADHGFEKNLTGKVGAIALATLCSKLITTPLNKWNISLSFQSAATLSVMHCLVGGAFTYWNQKSPLELEHEQYSTDIKAWKALPPEKRLELIIKFYVANLPAITLSFLSAENHPYAWWEANPLCSEQEVLAEMNEEETWNEKLSALTKNELTWHREIANSNTLSWGDWNLPFLDKCEEMGVPFPQIDTRYGHEGDAIDQWKDLLYRECQRRPIYYHIHLQLQELLTDRDPLPSLLELANQLDAKAIETMPLETLTMWYAAFRGNRFSYDLVEWKQLSKDTRSAFIKEWFANKLDIDYSFYCNLDTPEWAITLKADEVQHFSDEEKNRYFELLHGTSTIGVPFEVLYILNSGHESWDTLTYPLSHEVVAKAESDPTLQNQLIDRGWQEGSLRRLPVVDQIKLRDLLKTKYSAPFYYTISDDLITYMEENPDQQQEIIRGIAQIDDDDLANVTFENQRALKKMLAESGYHLFPGYFLSKELIAAAQNDDQLLEAIKKQFLLINRSYNYFGYFDLSPEEQQHIQDLFGNDAHLIPIKLTSTIVSQLEHDQELLKRVKGQFANNYVFNDFGYFDLSPEEQQHIQDLFGNDAHLIPIKLTSVLVSQLEEDKDLLEKVIKQFKAHKRHSDFGFSELSNEDQQALITLFGNDAGNLPGVGAQQYNRRYFT